MLVFGTFEALLPFIPYLLALAATILLFFLFRSKRNLERKINSFVANYKGEPGQDGEKFLFEARDEIWLKTYTSSDKMVFKVDPVSFLVNRVIYEFRKTLLYSISSYFVGVALIITFIMIGHSVKGIADTLGQLSNAQAKQTATTMGVHRGPKEVLTELSHPIGELKEKFYVSATGIFATIVYQLLAQLMAHRLRVFSRERFYVLQKHSELHDARDLSYQNQQAIGALDSANTLTEIMRITKDNQGLLRNESAEIIKALGDLRSIDVKIDDLAESVTKGLEASIDKSVGDKLTALLQAQNNMTEKISAELGRVLAESIGNELKAAFQSLASELPKIVSGGAADASNNMANAMLESAKSFGNVATSIQPLVDSMHKLVSDLAQQQGRTKQLTDETIGKILSSLSETIAKGKEEQIEREGQQARFMAEIQTSIKEMVDSSVKMLADSTKANDSAAVSVRERLREGAGAFSGSIEEIKGLVAQIDQVSRTSADRNGKIVEMANEAISASNRSLQLINEKNKDMATILSNMRELSGAVSKAPDQVKELVERVDLSIRTQTQQLEQMAYKTEGILEHLNQAYDNGVTKIAEVYGEHIGTIHSNVDVLSKRLIDAAQAIKDSDNDQIGELVASLKDLSKNIQEKRGA